MSALAVIPSTLPNAADIGDLVRSTAIRALEALDDAETPEEVNSLRKQWEAFVLLADVKRRRSSAQAAAVSRMMEVRLGEMLTGRTTSGHLDDISREEVTTFRLMWAYREVVEDVIAHATNAAPATRNRVTEAIRWHRLNIGDLKSTRPIKNRVRTPRHVRDRIAPTSTKPETFATSQTQDGDMSVVYQRIRQAQSVLARCPSSFKVEVLTAALVQAEALTVELIRDARCQA